MGKTLKDFVVEHPVDRERVEELKERMPSEAHACGLCEQWGMGGLIQAPPAPRDGGGRRPN